MKIVSPTQNTNIMRLHIYCVDLASSVQQFTCGLYWLDIIRHGDMNNLWLMLIIKRKHQVYNSFLNDEYMS